MNLEDFHLEHDHSLATRRHYKMVLRRYGDQPITDKGLARYRDIRLAEGVSQATIRGELSRLCAFAKWQGERLKFRLPRKITRAPQAWTAWQLSMIFRQARRTRREIYGVPGNVFWPALLGLAYDTGERIGAMIALTWDDVDLAGRTVRYRAETRKGCCEDRIAEFSRTTAAALDKMRHFGGPQIFLRGHKTSLWRGYTNLLEDAGLPHDRRSKFHKLRRTHATWLHAAGGDATAALGHASDATTRRHYLDPRFAKRVRLPSPLKWLHWLW